MKSLNMKLMLSAVGIALLATPALAQGQHHKQSTQQQSQNLYDSAAPSSVVGTYPNGAARSGSVYSRESGAEDNLIR
jgi:hypothetical protein